MQPSSFGPVSNAERQEILRLHERRTALEELLLTLDSPDLSVEQRVELESDIHQDLERTTALFENWWRTIDAKYRLPSAGPGRWFVDFESRLLRHEPRAVTETGDCPSCNPNPPPDDGAQLTSVQAEHDATRTRHEKGDGHATTPEQGAPRCHDVCPRPR